MKKIAKLSFIILLGTLLLSPVAGFSQTLKDFFNNGTTPVVYLGLDFTKTKMLGDAGANTSDIVARQFAGINDVIVNEPKKYEIAEAFHRAKVDNDLSLVVKRNSAIKPDELISMNSSDYNRLKEADITTLVKGFDFAGKKGIGILFVVEAMSKTDKGEAIWVTLIDMAAKKVLLTERMVGKPGGIGFRNYWVSPVKEVLKDIEKSKYDEWKAKYGG